MSYRIGKRESVAAGVRRVAGEQVEQALVELRREHTDRGHVVHQIRKRCKKLRGLVRLVRSSLGETYSTENAFFRDVAGGMAAVRDAQSIIDCFDRLTRREPNGWLRSPIREVLIQRRRQIGEEQIHLSERLRELQQRLQEAQRRIASWRLSDDGFSAIEPGLRGTYARARRLLKRLRQDDAESNHSDAMASDADWHALRTQVKYHWHHMRLLRRVWPEIVQARRRAARKLDDALGDAHDLSILHGVFTAEKERFSNLAETQICLALIDHRRQRLRLKALPAASRLFAEKPRRFTHRFRRYWHTWKSSA